MSDFNRNTDPAYRPADPQIGDPLVNDPYTRRPIEVEERRSGMGAWAAIIAIVVLAGGGFYLYNHADRIHTAANDTAATSSTSPATTSPQLNNARATPTPAQTPAPAQSDTPAR